MVAARLFKNNTICCSAVYQLIRWHDFCGVIVITSIKMMVGALTPNDYLI